MKNKLLYRRKITPNRRETGIVSMNSIKKEKRLKVMEKLFSIALGLVLPVLLVIFGTIIQKNEIYMIENLFTKPMGVLIINLIIFYLIYFFFQVIINRPSASYFITCLLYLALPIISRLKYDVRGEVLIHNDLSLVSQLGEVASFAEVSGYTLSIIIFVFTFIIVTTILIAFQRTNTNRITSLVSTIILTVLLSFVLFIPSISNKLLTDLNINLNVRYSPNILHEKYGTILGFYANYKLNVVTRPNDYSKEKIFAILNSANKEKEDNSHILKKSTDDIKPNIVMIMSESFFDPTRIKDVSFSEDPIPTVRKMMEMYTSGTLVTSTFAGATSNVEYEAFTGESTSFMPYGTVPYTDLKNELKNADTIQKVLKKNGYKTVGLHTYDGDFYNRRENYKYIGFDEFKDMNELENAGYYGKYVSDLTITDNIISELEKQKKGEPIYIWALTMQNHTPYATSNYDKEAIKVTVSGDMLTDVAYDKLTAYINGIYESDRCLKRLIDYLEESKTPTIVMFYGDHLPSLYEAFYDTGMIKTKDTSKWTTKEMLDMHQIPFFIYNNYNLKKEYNHNEVLGAMLLGNRLLNEAGIKKSSYFNFLDTINYLALRDRLFIDENGSVSSEITAECNRKAEEQKMLQYDMIYGNNYIAEYDKIY